MLQIRLKKDPSSEGSGGGGGAAGGGGGAAGGAGGAAKPSPVETVTVACPEHLVLAELPVAKGLGTATSLSHPKIVGRKSRRQLGERVHFCVRCDFPIAIYGRLSPCEHAFCLDCARSDSICYLCDDRIQKIQTIKMMEGIFICAAPHCLKSFMKKNEFESHIHENHADLLHPNAEKEDGNESDSRSNKQSVSEATARAPPRPVFSPSSPQFHDREDKFRFQQSRDQPPFRPAMSQKSPAYSGHGQNIPSENQADPQRPPGFDRPALHDSFHPQGMDAHGPLRQESGLFPERQPGILSDMPFHGYPPMHPLQQPNYGMPVPSNPMMMSQPPFGFPSFPAEGGHPFFGSADMARPDSVPEAGHEPGSLLGFPPGIPGGMNFVGNYSQPWNPGMANSPFEPSTGGQGAGNGFVNSSDGQAKAAFYQNEYFRNSGGLPLNAPPPLLGKGGASNADVHDGKGILAPQPMPVPPPPPTGASSHMSHTAPGKFYRSDVEHEGQGFGWQHNRHDSYGSSQD